MKYVATNLEAIHWSIRLLQQAEQSMYYQLPGVRVKPKLKFENSNDYPIKKLPIFKLSIFLDFFKLITNISNFGPSYRQTHSRYNGPKNKSNPLDLNHHRTMSRRSFCNNSTNKQFAKLKSLL